MKFYDFKEKECVMKNCGKLKGTSINVSNDYAKVTVQVRKKLWDSAAGDRAQGKKTALVHDKLKVDNRLYGWDHKLKKKRFPFQNMRGKGDRDNAKEASTSHSPPGTTPSSA